MGIDLLDAPVRLTWDLYGPGEPLTGGQLLTCADRLAAAGVFYVTLQERPLVHPDIGSLLERLGSGGCRAVVTCSGLERELEALERLDKPLPAVSLDVSGWIDGAALDETRLTAILDRICRAGCEPVLQLTPLRSNLLVIPHVLDFCRLHGVGCLKLPNARIGDTYRSCAAADLPRWDDLEVFRGAWVKQTQCDAGGPRVEIHDRFLWEIMAPGDERARSEYGGCQAANSLGHVDAQGTVYACEAWPVRLGALTIMDLEEIWQSPRRFEVRNRVAEIPAGCRGCCDYSLCLGGCRGLGEVLGQDCGGRDLMCRAPRQ